MSEIKVPCLKLLPHVQKLIDIKSPYLLKSDLELNTKRQEIDSIFNLAMQEIILWHRKLNPYYEGLCKQEKFSDFKSYQQIPWILAQFFKQHEVLTIDQDKVFLHLTSSGTQGQKSQIFFDEWSIKSAQSMLNNIIDYLGWRSSKAVDYLLYTYAPKKDLNLGTAYTDNYLCQYADALEVSYALKSDGQDYQFDLFGCIDAIYKAEKRQVPLRIFGFPAFLYFTLQKMQELGCKPLKLHPESLVFLGGGWKKHADKSIDKLKFYQQIEDFLGIASVRIRDGFGSVEHCVPYVECSQHNLHVPIYSKVIIRDPIRFNDVGYGKEGLLQLMSPYITSVPAHNIVMSDLAILRPGSECGCELATDFFNIIGRAGTAKNKTCAIAASELLGKRD